MQGKTVLKKGVCSEIFMKRFYVAINNEGKGEKYAKFDILEKLSHVYLFKFD